MAPSFLKKAKVTEKGIITPKIPNLTIFTDASLKSGIVGGGFWAVYGDKQKLTGTVAELNVTKSHEAEIIVAVKSVRGVLASQEVSSWVKSVGSVRVILVSDCMAVKHAVETKSAGYHLFQDTLDALEVLGVLIKVNHVKGHTNDTSARAYVNAWCDTQANARRERVYAQLKKGDTPFLGTLFSNKKSVGSTPMSGVGSLSIKNSDGSWSQLGTVNAFEFSPKKNHHDESWLEHSLFDKPY